MTKASYIRESLIGAAYSFRGLDCDHHGSRQAWCRAEAESKPLQTGGRKKPRERLGMVWAFESSTLTPSDTPPPTKPHPEPTRFRKKRFYPERWGKRFSCANVPPSLSVHQQGQLAHLPHCQNTCQYQLCP
jgi:hypothetical protein